MYIKLGRGLDSKSGEEVLWEVICLLHPDSSPALSGGGADTVGEAAGRTSGKTGLRHQGGHESRAEFPRPGRG